MSIMGVKATTNVENKPKATVKNLQFIEKLDRLIDIVEKAEENGDATKVKHRSSYDLVNVRSLYIERYDWFDTDKVRYVLDTCKEVIKELGMEE